MLGCFVILVERATWKFGQRPVARRVELKNSSAPGLLFEHRCPATCTFVVSCRAILNSTIGES